MEKSNAVRVLTVLLALTFIISLSPGWAKGPKAVNQRPIEDFLEAQGDEGSFCGGGYIVWFDPSNDRVILVDYAGQEDYDAMGLTAPTFEGTVTERPLPGGQIKVSVNLRTYGALTYVYDDDSGDMLFGYTPGEVVGGETAALGEAHLKTEFILDQGTNEDLPDYCDVALGETGEGLADLFSAYAMGELREASGYSEGTPGAAQTTQRGLYSPASPGDSFPAEHVHLMVEIP